MKQSMYDVLKDAHEVEPLAEVNGMKVVTFEEANIMNNAELIEPTPDSGDRTINPDGTIARSRVKVVAINPDSLFINRYRIVKGKGKGADKIEIVVDYRAIKEQERGQIYLQRIPSYIIARHIDENGGKGDLYLEKATTVSDKEFIEQFTRKYNDNAMRQILPLIASESQEITTDDIQI